MVKSLHDEQTSKIASEALGRLFELTIVLGELMQDGLAERGLTRARATLISELRRLGPVTQRELSHTLRVTPRNVTGLIDALQAAGLVARGRHPTDRRATLVRLTPEGEAIATALQADHDRFAARLFHDLPAARTRDLVATLDRVLERMRQA